LWIALDCCERRRRSLNVFFGDTYGTEISRATNFAANIRSKITSWISIVRAQSCIELDGGGIIIVQAKFAIHAVGIPARHGVLCCDSGIIRFARELDSVLRAIWFALEERQQKQSLTFILSLWERERRGPRSVCRVSQPALAVRDNGWAPTAVRRAIDRRAAPSQDEFPKLRMPFV
jgi:hypothetical protein